MSRVQVAAGLAYWAAQERKTRAKWQRIQRKRVSTAEHAHQRRLAYRAWNRAHQMRVRRGIELRDLDASSWKIDNASIRALIEREGVIPYAYADSRGFATAWIGHLIRLGPLRPEDYHAWGSKEHPADPEKVIAYFHDVDLVPYEKTVDDVIRARVKNGHRVLTPKQRGALVSLCFNIGTGGFATSTVASLVRAGAERQEVGAAFMLWSRPPEIIGRRKSERDQYVIP